jgi:hypothetical protein
MKLIGEMDVKSSYHFAKLPDSWLMYIHSKRNRTMQKLLAIFTLAASTVASAQSTVYSCQVASSFNGRNNLELVANSEAGAARVIIDGMEAKSANYEETGGMRYWFFADNDKHQIHMKPNGVTFYFDFTGKDKADAIAVFECYVKK